MKKKILVALVPACITFGPLFMMGVVGTAPYQFTPMLGCFMVIVGLGIMFRMIMQQQSVIEKMRRSAPPSER